MIQPKEISICDECLQMDADYLVYTLDDKQVLLCEECFEEQARSKN
jgi:hypothetical protein